MAVANNKPKALLSWSSGKDSAWALEVARRENIAEVVGLMTTVNSVEQRVSMHAVRETLVDVQARAVGLPLEKVYLPFPCPNNIYERLMSGVVARALESGITAFIFGDLFLEEIRRYREKMLAHTGIRALFPLWGRDTSALADEMLADGLCAKVTCVDSRRLGPDFVGREYDRRFLNELPQDVDPCGENGEFHTFVYNGPMFRSEVPVKSGKVKNNNGFMVADILPA